jgi:hypothetical protein
MKIGPCAAPPPWPGRRPCPRPGSGYLQKLRRRHDQDACTDPPLSPLRDHRSQRTTTHPRPRIQPRSPRDHRPAAQGSLIWSVDCQVAVLILPAARAGRQGGVWGRWEVRSGRRRRAVETDMRGLVTCMTGCSSGTGSLSNIGRRSSRGPGLPIVTSRVVPRVSVPGSPTGRSVVASPQQRSLPAGPGSVVHGGQAPAPAGELSGDRDGDHGGSLLAGRHGGPPVMEATVGCFAPGPDRG